MAFLLVIFAVILLAVACSKPQKPVQTIRKAPVLMQVPSAKGKILYYRNPMDAKITSPVPKKDDMGMDYIPVYEAPAQAQPSVQPLALPQSPPAEKK